MIKKGTLSNGFKYEVDDAVMDDMRLIDAISESMEDEPLKISKVIKMVKTGACPQMSLPRLSQRFLRTWEMREKTDVPCRRDS